MTKKKATLAERFAAFDQANPQVYEGVLSYAIALRFQRFDRWNGLGRMPRIGIAEVTEKLRYDMAKTKHAEKYKLNNSYRAFYARKLIEDRPDLFLNVIQIRKQKPVPDSAGGE